VTALAERSRLDSVRALKITARILAGQWNAQPRDERNRKGSRIARLLSRAPPRTRENPTELQARADCQTAMWLAMTGMGSLVPMGASHGIGHVLGGTCDVPHGYTTCVMLPSVLRHNESIINADRQALIGETMGQPGRPAADVISDLIRSLDMPSTLKEVGVGSDGFELIAKNALLARWVHSNPRKISGADDVLEILQMAA
jgi:maleylacetate reductase